ncbi:hypothetical protein, partial [Cellulosimicrobium sp. CUA-896]|uniref:hypothetical protein n=1 Tax=Cellulosimicrobium sp. CUA-896 TaxID=1517881 RepID=UPI000967D577
TAATAAPTAATGATEAGRTAAWARVLDELATMAGDAGEHAGEEAVARLVAWTPPEDLGPLPPSLVERALDVVARLGGTVGSLHAAMATNRRHARALEAVPAAHDTTAAAYLDVSA